jgi:hypothetical protein
MQPPIAGNLVAGRRQSRVFDREAARAARP